MATSVTPDQLAAGREYEKLFVPALFKPWTPQLLSAARVEPGCRVLDVACGTGVLARDALAVVGPDGAVAGLDPAPGMLAVAGEREPRIEWLLGSAESLPLADRTFDCVVSQFGMMFFADPHRAAAEMLRVLKPAGRIALAVWDEIDRNPAYAIISELLDELVGSAAGEALRLPFTMGDAMQAIEALSQAGFVELDRSTQTATARYSSIRTAVEAELRGWLPLFDILLESPLIEAVVAQAERRLSRYSDASGVAEFPTSAHLIAAARP